jgi:hypothetical protein
LKFESKERFEKVLLVVVRDLNLGLLSQEGEYLMELNERLK